MYWNHVMFLHTDLAISHNAAFDKNIISLNYCSALLKIIIIISDNYEAISIMYFEVSDVTFDKKILFALNKCNTVITIKSDDDDYPYINIMQHANITFLYNEYIFDLIKIEFISDPYRFCLFQYVSIVVNTSITTAEYTIIFTENLANISDYVIFTKCMLTFKTLHFRL